MGLLFLDVIFSCLSKTWVLWWRGSWTYLRLACDQERERKENHNICCHFISIEYKKEKLITRARRTGVRLACVSWSGSPTESHSPTQPVKVDWGEASLCFLGWFSHREPLTNAASRVHANFGWKKKKEKNWKNKKKKRKNTWLVYFYASASRYCIFFSHDHFWEQKN